MRDLDKCYLLRSVVESGLSAGLEELELDVITRANHPENFQQVRPRLELKCAIGAATGHKAICPDGFTRYDCFRFTAAIQAVTQTTPESRVTHDALLAMVRAYCSTAAANSVTDHTKFPNIRLAIPLQESSSVSYQKDKDGVEYTSLSFQGIVQIRPESWPTTT